jgi:hypothetical protein
MVFLLSHLPLVVFEIKGPAVVVQVFILDYIYRVPKFVGWE